MSISGTKGFLGRLGSFWLGSQASKHAKHLRRAVTSGENHRSTNVRFWHEADIRVRRYESQLLTESGHFTQYACDSRQPDRA